MGLASAPQEVAMTGQVHWLPFVILLIAALPIVYLWFRNRRDERKYIVEHHRVRCRARGSQLADCTLVRDANTGEPIGIQSCSAQPGGVRCERECLPLFVKAA
jgi:hypothetical protein